MQLIKNKIEQSNFYPDNHIIIIYYIDVSGLTKSCAEKLIADTISANKETSNKIKQIFLPVQSTSRVECIQLTSNKI